MGPDVIFAFRNGEEFPVNPETRIACKAAYNLVGPLTAKERRERGLNNTWEQS